MPAGVARWRGIENAWGSYGPSWLSPADPFKRGAVEPRPVSERGVPYEDTELCGHFRFGPADGGLAPPFRYGRTKIIYSVDL